ncbi:MAG TPA: DMT family transporter [Gemmatimonadaceae bacterium]|nr:DMT family transporter [Gemmatimonadaceae bacterium]
MAPLLAILASICYGSGDFLGGLASRRSSSLAVAAISQLLGLAPLAIALLVAGPATPRTADLAWGAAAGFAGAIALALFFKALTLGRMGVMAPIASATGDAVAVLIGFALGERPAPLVLAGFVLAVVSIVLVAQDRPDPDGASERGVFVAIGCGIALGAWYSCLRPTSVAAGLWPLVTARAVSLPVLILWTRARGRSLALPRSVLMIALPSGVLDILANVCYLIAVRQGMLSIVATLASLNPIVTVALAWRVLHERLRAPQYLGLVLGIAAMAMISLG